MNWILKPSDPSDAEIELSDYVYAQYLSAVISMVKHCGYSFDDLTAEVVYDHMINRAKNYPQCMVNVMAIHYVQALQLMREGERCGGIGGIELVICAQKVLLRPLAVTNAYK